MAVDYCKSCKRPIMWAATLPRGRMMPLDLYPDPAGNVALFYRVSSFSNAAATVLGGQELMMAHQIGVLLHTSHFATCPHAAEHRKEE